MVLKVKRWRFLSEEIKLWYQSRTDTKVHHLQKKWKGTMDECQNIDDWNGKGLCLGFLLQLVIGRLSEEVWSDKEMVNDIEVKVGTSGFCVGCQLSWGQWWWWWWQGEGFGMGWDLKSFDILPGICWCSVPTLAQCGVITILFSLTNNEGKW